MACADGVSLHFSKDRAELNLDAVGKVLLTVSTLEACPAANAIVIGHSDPGELNNLASARAKNVAAVITKNGIAGQRIRVADTPAPSKTSPEPDNRFVSISWK